MCSGFAGSTSMSGSLFGNGSSQSSCVLRRRSTPCTRSRTRRPSCDGPSRGLGRRSPSTIDSLLPRIARSPSSARAALPAQHRRERGKQPQAAAIPSMLACSSLPVVDPPRRYCGDIVVYRRATIVPWRSGVLGPGDEAIVDAARRRASRGRRCCRTRARSSSSRSTTRRADRLRLRATSCRGATASRDSHRLRGRGGRRVPAARHRDAVARASSQQIAASAASTRASC